MSLVEGAIQLLLQLDQKGELEFEQAISAMTVKVPQVANQQQLGSVQYMVIQLTAYFLIRTVPRPSMQVIG